MRVDIMVEMEPVVEKPLDNHLNNTTASDPLADHIPWGAGVDSRDVPWRPEKSALSPCAQTAILVNLATEDDNLLKPLLWHWRIFDPGGLDAPAEGKREELAAHMASLQRAVVREQEISARLAAHAENQEAQRCPSPSS